MGILQRLPDLHTKVGSNGKISFLLLNAPSPRISEAIYQIVDI